MREIYPAIEPYATHRITVDEPHVLYVEECGNPQGVPVVFLHGGPGAGCEIYHRRYFNPQIYRIVLFDQRGCGRSTPHAELSGNTTWDLVSDMEIIRRKLSIDRWAIFGGSWGSTLALAYAEVHPENVSGLVLRGIFLARKRDIDWFYQWGTRYLFPDYWQDFESPVAEADRHDMVSAYYKLLTSSDEQVKLQAAKAWSVWEGRTATLKQDVNVVEHFSEPHTSLSVARIECHYFMNDSFLRPNQLVEDANKLKNIPGYIVHGRYDVICPLEQAWELHRAWPSAKFNIIADAGHAVVEKGITDALIAATDELGGMLKS